MQVLRWLRRTFLGGLLVVLPLAVTVYIIWLIVRLMNNFMTPLSAFIQNNLGFVVPGIGIYVTLLLVLLLGVVTRHYLGRRLVQSVEQRVIYSIPIVRKMYGTVKQVIDAIFTRDTTAFKRVVLVEYPRKGIYTIGFVTNAAKGVLGRHLPVTCLSVFVFTVPNPMSGYYIIVPESDVIDLNVPVEEGIRMSISMGMILDERAAPLATPPPASEETHAPVQQEVL